MLLADCGTIWTKLADIDGGSQRIVRSSGRLHAGDTPVLCATGHLGRQAGGTYENELVALAEGARALVKDDDFTVVDVGGRDIKYVTFRRGILARMNWNQSCGATTGFLLDLAGSYYRVDYTALQPAHEYAPMTCGIFGIEQVFDAIISGTDEHTAISRLVGDLAYTIHGFVERPAAVYLSGGLCDNLCFVRSLERHCRVVPLGRFVLIEGLRAMMSGRRGVAAGAGWRPARPSGEYRSS